MRCVAKIKPLTAPYRRSASIAYSEQLGVNRQDAPRCGERISWYPRTRDIRNRRGICRMRIDIGLMDVLRAVGFLRRTKWLGAYGRSRLLNGRVDIACYCAFHVTSRDVPLRIIRQANMIVRARASNDMHVDRRIESCKRQASGRWCLEK